LKAKDYTMSMRTVVVSLAVLALLAACERDEPMPTADQPEVTEKPVLEEQIMPVEPPAEVSLERAVEAARAELAERTGAAAESIRVADARHVTWRDGALGCPEEDMMYTQALVEGMYILLELDGEQHPYHAGRDGMPFACPVERSQPPLEQDSGAARE
jgi:hypothetical protein